MIAPYDKKKPEPFIRSVAIEATGWIIAFNNVRGAYKYHRFNHMTQDKNCFHGNTKTKCDVFICPMKGEVL